MLRVLGRICALCSVLFASLDAGAQSPPAASFPAADNPAPAAPAPPPAAASAPSPSPSPSPSPRAAAPAPAAVAPAAPQVFTPTEPEEPAARQKPRRYVSLTMSPLHLLSPVFELTVEAMLTPHFGVGAIGGIGSVKAESNDPRIDGEEFSAYELGLQLVGYPLQEFSSLQLGAELLWLRVSTENFGGEEIRANAGGFGLGPFIGYKILTAVGFTFFAQGGFQYLAVKAEASDTAGNTNDEEQDTVIPLLNLNLGWSF